MAVLQMQKLYICALKSNRKQLLEDLQRRGLVQIEASGEEDPLFQRMDTAPMRTGYEKRARTAEDALKVLDQYAPEKRGMLDSLNGKTEISLADYEKNVKQQEQSLSIASHILALQKKLTESRAQQSRLLASRESLVPWMRLDLPLDARGTKTTAILLGALPGQWTLEQLQSALAEDAPGLEAFDLEILGSDPTQTCIFAACLRADSGQMEDALRKNGFARPSVQSSLTPSAYDEKLRKKYEESLSEEQALLSELASLSTERGRLRFLSDYYTMRADKYRVLGQLLQSRHVFFITGYIPKQNAARLKSHLEDAYCCTAELEDIPADESAPVLLRNNGFSAPTEGVVTSYGLPHKGEIDPTGIMAVFYYFFFGLMLSDAGYGILMTVGCFIFLKKYPRMAQGLKNMLTMFMYCGISTTFWGIMFGGYFGDVIPVVARTFFHTELTIPAVWFVPLDDPMRLLMFSFLFGIIHLFTGLAIKGFLLIRDRKYMDCLCEVGFWYMLLIGLILMLLPSDMFASMAGVTLIFPAWLNLLAKILAITGALGIVLMTGRRRKNFGLRLALGAYELYGATSWLSDVLSYSRLLALGLATGVIASVINTMGAMAGGGVIGAIAFVLIFLVGHTLNLAINLLGAYVHTNRLQYVEFFGKFYEGGGDEFHPFSADSSKYFKIKEEN